MANSVNGLTPSVSTCEEIAVRERTEHRIEKAMSTAPARSASYVFCDETERKTRNTAGECGEMSRLCRMRGVLGIPNVVARGRHE
jgi:hypothetical protein